MYVTKITPQNALSQRAYNYRVQNPMFGYRTIPTKPFVENENGSIIFEKVLRLLKCVPEKGKLPWVSLINAGDKSYGIMIDKTTPAEIKVDIKNMTENKIWDEIKNVKDIFSGRFDEHTGRMLEGNFNGIRFYRNLNKRTRRMQIGGIPFSPVSYGSDNWGTMINKDELNKDTLGSIFLAMTKQTASILPK